jgi:predicted dienelactone hydrolase
MPLFWHRRMRLCLMLASAVAVVLVGGAILLTSVFATGTLTVRHPNLPGAAGTSRSETGTTSAAILSTRSGPVFTPDGTYAVGTSALEVVEQAATGGTHGRSLPAAVWYPARGRSGDGGQGLVPDRAHAPYPLLVFSQGYDLSVKAYATLLADWASAGFVVAAPTYAHTDPSDPAELDENDIANHPADLRYVITTLLKAARRSGSVLSGLIDANEIGVVGHSDGGDVSLAVAANSCCRDPRVRAAVILSGAELASFGGSYFSSGSPPLLVSQGSADTINLPACSIQIFDAAGSPKYYLDLLGAHHEAPYVEPGPDQEIVARVTTEFFDGELADQTSALAALAADGNIAGRSSLTHAASGPQKSGGCPGAPG